MWSHRLIGLVARNDDTWSLDIHKYILRHGRYLMWDPLKLHHWRYLYNGPFQFAFFVIFCFVVRLAVNSVVLIEHYSLWWMWNAMKWWASFTSKFEAQCDLHFYGNWIHGLNELKVHKIWCHSYLSPPTTIAIIWKFWTELFSKQSKDIRKIKSKLNWFNLLRLLLATLKKFKLLARLRV